MALTPGVRLGPYEILSVLGAGGMGEVFRARDTRLQREVAIKVLPDSLADDAGRLTRFTREAQTLASLNHPHIAQIFGLEESGGVRALVMELVEGEDLSQRIARGAVPFDEALPIAKQIAEALEAAHEQGIVHRDLKPANVKVRSDGTVKVLDFGLAKAVEGPNRAGPTGGDLSKSPTVTSPAMTHAGMILGTAAYMSPEQASGRPLDKRTDIWSFGVVLWEMVTGRRLFDAETVSHTLADVLGAPIEFSRLPAGTPRLIRDLLRRCLNRDVKKRLRDIGDARLVLEEVLNDRGEDSANSASPTGAPVVSGTRERVAWMLAAAFGVVSLASLALAAFAFLGKTPAEVRSTRFLVSPPDGWRVTTEAAPNGAAPAPLAVSPDGSRIAFVANAATGGSRLWVRALDTLTAQELPGTNGAASPFWSPDGRFLGFFADGKLKKIEVDGGSAVTLCATPEFRGGAWGRDGVIVFASTATSALQRVSALGGAPSAATALGEAENFHWRPSFLPDGRHFVYRSNTGGLYVTSLDSTDSTLVSRNPDDSVNVVYSRGHLLFLRETTLMAQPFDLGRLTLTGEPIPIAEGVLRTSSNPFGVFSASDTGVLVYQTGTSAGRHLTWFDRAGRLLATVERPGMYNTVALSPDGTRVAVSRDDPPSAVNGGQTLNTDLWVYDFGRSTSTRLTFGPAVDWMAVWSPDGSRIAWSTNRDDRKHNLYQKMANGAGNEDALLKSGDVRYAYDWSKDGHFLLYATVPANGKFQLWVLPLTGDDRSPTAYLQTDWNTSQAQFSPDSRYIAYRSDESGTSEVYVQPFPTAAGGKWIVSQGGGSQPRWQGDGKELFYLSADSKIMAVPVVTTPAFTPGVPQALFAAPILGGGTPTNVTRYDVTADGQKFLINVVSPETTTAPPAPMTVVLNWTAGLKP